MEPCRILEWDSDFFGCRIGALTEEPARGDTIPSAVAWARAYAVDCLYALAESLDGETIAALEQAGFCFVNIKVTLDARIGDPFIHSSPDSGVSIHQYTEDDLKELCRMAGENHRITRFFADPHFDRGKCEQMYRLWITQCCTSSTTQVYIAFYEGTPAGYISLRMNGDTQGEIVLAGVDHRFRGRGIGTQLVQTARDWFLRQGATSALVVTQGGNIQALRLYTSMGFYPRTVQLWYHRWFSAKRR